MKEVKKEIFGTRKSVLKTVLDENGIEYISNIWIVTCRREVNPDKKSRYCVFVEGDTNIRKIATNIKNDVPIYQIIFNEDNQKISICNLNGDSLNLTRQEFKEWLIKKVKCEYKESFASGSNNASNFSRFFRENMGKAFSLTDIDFFLVSQKLLIEEKGFVKNGYGYLGVGQCWSFFETINDIFKENISFMVISYDKEDSQYFVGNVRDIDCNIQKSISGWGQMVEYQVQKKSHDELMKLMT